MHRFRASFTISSSLSPELKDECMNEWMNGWMDGWMNVLGYIKLSQHCLLVYIYIYINTRPLSEPSRFYVLLLLSSRSCLAPSPPSLGSLSLTWPHMSACWSFPPPPSRGWMLLSLKAIRYTSHLTHSSAGGALRWAGADTFLLTITSHTGPTFHLSGPLGFSFPFTS